MEAEDGDLGRGGSRRMEATEESPSESVEARMTVGRRGDHQLHQEGTVDRVGRSSESRKRSAEQRAIRPMSSCPVSCQPLYRSRFAV